MHGSIRMAHTWTLNTPQTGVDHWRFAFSKMAAGSSRFPSMRVIWSDFWASFFAEAELMSRVTASILNGACFFSRLSMTEPPCLPVAPVIRMVVMVEWDE